MCGFGWGHPIVPLLVSFAHIHAKYLIHFYFFLMFPIIHKMFQRIQRFSMLGKDLLIAAQRKI